ncbi:MAG: ATPase, partial [Chloroflexus aggregans]
MSTWRQWIRPEQIRELSLIGLIVIALLIFGWQIENFLSARTFNRITSSVAIVGMVAIGQTLVVLTRNIDLSVGSIVGFTAYFVGSQLAANSDIPP